MKFTSILLLIGSTAFVGCSTAANNGNNANMRGTNTNTGYVTNSETNAKPTMPANVTNISPPSMNAVTGNGNSNHNTAVKSNSMSNANSNMNSKANTGNTKKP